MADEHNMCSPGLKGHTVNDAGGGNIAKQRMRR